MNALPVKSVAPTAFIDWTYALPHRSNRDCSPLLPLAYPRAPLDANLQSSAETSRERSLVHPTLSHASSQPGQSSTNHSPSIESCADEALALISIADNEASEPMVLVTELPDVNPIHEMIAGSVAACVTRFCIAPLDVIKIRFQIQESAKHYRSVLQAVRTITKEEGWRAFWKGNMAAELMVVPYGAVSFLSYQKCRHALERVVQRNYSFTAPTHGPSSSSTTISPFHHHLVNISSGSFAGFCATVATYPLDLMRTRFAAQQEPKLYHSLWSAFVSVVHAEGVRGLYLGMWPTLCGIVPLMAIQFGCYEGLKLAVERVHARKEEEEAERQQLVYQRMFEQRNIHSQALSMGESSSSGRATNGGAAVNSHSSIKFWEQTLCGFTAGVISKFVTMPFDVIKKRFQVSGFAWDASKRIPSAASIAPSAAVAPTPTPYTAHTVNLNPHHQYPAYHSDNGVPKGVISSYVDPHAANACPQPCKSHESATRTPIRRQGDQFSHHHHHHHASHPNSATSTLASTSTPVGSLTSPATMGSHMISPNAASIQPPAPSIKPPPSAASTPPPSSINERPPGPNSQLSSSSKLPALKSMLTGASPLTRPAPITFAAGHRPFTGVIDCARGIIRHEGWLGLFKGTVPSTLKAGPNSALIYVFYEQAMNFLQTLDQHRKERSVTQSHH